MTSYVTRLATAHLVRPSWLLKSVSINAPAKGARALNGTCGTTTAAVETLKRLLTVRDLNRLTLLPWKAVFSPMNSLAETQQWCPPCLNQWKSEGIPAHYPLLWCLTTVRWCEEHQCRLATHCPNSRCGSLVDLFAPPGRCRHCFAWLGRAETPSRCGDFGEDRDVWFAQATAGILGRGQRPGGVPSPEHMRHGFSWLFDVVGGGRWDHLRKRMGLSADVLFRWRVGRGLPSLDMFLTFCSRLNMEPDDLLDADAPKRLDPGTIRAAPMATERAAPRAPNKHVDRKVAREHLERSLKLKIEPRFAPALDHVASDIGVSSQLLRYHFPELARAISLRWRSRFRASARS